MTNCSSLQYHAVLRTDEPRLHMMSVLLYSPKECLWCIVPLKLQKGHWAREFCLSCAIYFVYKSFVVEMQHILVGRWTRQLELGMLLKLPRILRRLIESRPLGWLCCVMQFCSGFCVLNIMFTIFYIYFVYKSFVVEMQHILVGRWTRQLELGMLLKLPRILLRLIESRPLGCLCCVMQFCSGFVF